MNASNEYEKLSMQKTEIENDIEVLNKILVDENNIGMNGLLIDDQGYPRADIDIYKVRLTRQKINCLKNDYIEVIQKIEKALNDKLGNTTTNHQEPNSEQTYPAPDRLRPFLKVTNISPGSPSDQAGFKNNDEIAQFGPFTTGALTEIAEHVKSRANKVILVRVIRETKNGNNETIKAPIVLKLEPKTWDGPGILGCKLNSV